MSIIPSLFHSFVRRHFSLRFLARGRVLALTMIAILTAPAAHADVAAALKAIQRDGYAHIIVRMHSGAQTWRATDAPERQAAAVDAALSNAAPVLQSAQVRNFHRFRTLPYIAAMVDQAQLLNLAASSAVESIYLVQIEHKAATTASGPSALTSVSAIDVPNAWAMGYDGTGYAVAVLDDGFNLTHPMLSGKAVGDACFSDVFTGVTSDCPAGQAQQTGSGAASNCPTNSDGSNRCDHGTAVASVAVGNDGTNFGVARGANLVPITVTSTDSSPTDCSPDPVPCEVTDATAVLDALDYVNQSAAQYNIAAVNYSYSGALSSGYCDDDPRKPIIDMLRQKGITVAIAAGNDGVTGEVGTPACISSANAVGATDNGTNVASFSNYATMVSLMAPGVAIAAASGSGSGLTSLSGTSLATPHVAGAWAILRQASPNATFDQIESALKSSGTSVTRAGVSFSLPKIQVAQAINTLAGKDRSILNNVASSSAAAIGRSFLRVLNNSAAAGTVTVSLRDAPTGTLLGTWTSPSIAAGAAAQIPVQTIENALVPSSTAPFSATGRSYYNLDIATTFNGYLQHVLWASSAGVFANLTSCGTGFADDATIVANVHSSAIANYVSVIRIVNTGVVSGSAVLVVYDVNTGLQIGQWTSPQIASGASLEITGPQLEGLLPALQKAVGAGLLQYNVQLTSLSGYLQHVIQNEIAGAYVDMSAKCPLTAPPSSTVTASGAGTAPSTGTSMTIAVRQ